MSYEESYEKNIIAFVCRHLNHAIFYFNVPSLQRTPNNDNSTNLEANGGDNDGKNASSTSTKPTNDIESEQSKFGDENNEGSSPIEKKKRRVEITK